jgi:hypothetical protein
MLEITIKQKLDGAWVDMATPPTLSEQIDFLRQISGVHIIVRVLWKTGETYICGCEEEVIMMQAAKPKAVSMTSTEAHSLLETNPSLMIDMLRAFSESADKAA